jgi:hypothetical protein
MKENQILLFHGRTSDGRRFTIAGQYYSTMENGENDIIRLGAALCSESDSFVKKTGRKKAEGRIFARGPKGKSYFNLLHLNGAITGNEINIFIEAAKKHEYLTVKGFMYKFAL